MGTTKSHFSLRRLISLFLGAVVLILGFLAFLTVRVIDFRSDSWLILMSSFLTPWLEFGILLFILWQIMGFKRMDAIPFLKTIRIVVITFLSIIQIDVGYKTLLSAYEQAHFAEYNVWPYPGLPFDLRMNRLKQFDGFFFLSTTRQKNPLVPQYPPLTTTIKIPERFPSTMERPQEPEENRSDPRIIKERAMQTPPQQELEAQDESCNGAVSLDQVLGVMKKGEVTVTLECPQTASDSQDSFVCQCREPIAGTNPKKCRIYHCNSKGEAAPEGM